MEDMPNSKALSNKIKQRHCLPIENSEYSDTKSYLCLKYCCLVFSHSTLKIAIISKRSMLHTD